MDTDKLRTGTRSEHEAVEALMPLMDAELTRDQYIGVLRCMYSAVHSWEDWAAVHAPPRLAALVADRRRAHLIAADLQFLGAGAPSVPEPGGLDAILSGEAADQPAHEAAFLGAMYVVEGSTLGGQYIARHVENLFGLQPGAGAAYFRGYGEQTGAKWRGFKEHLLAIPEEHAAMVIDSARAMFAYFGRALEPCAAEAALPAGTPVPGVFHA